MLRQKIFQVRSSQQGIHFTEDAVQQQAKNTILYYSQSSELLENWNGKLKHILLNWGKGYRIKGKAYISK